MNRKEPRWTDEHRAAFAKKRGPIELSRRSFLTGAAGMGALAALGLTGCAAPKNAAERAAEPTPEPPHNKLAVLSILG